MALAISVLTSFWALLATLSLLWPGFASSTTISTWDDSLPEGLEHQRVGLRGLPAVPLLIFIGLGVLFYALGTPTRRNMVPVGHAGAHEVPSQPG